MTPLIRECVGFFPSAEELTWFDVGVIQYHNKLPDCGLPMEKCAVVAEAPTGDRVLLICSGNDTVIAAYAYSVVANAPEDRPIITYVRDAGEWKYLDRDQTIPVELHTYRSAVTFALSHFMRVSNPTGYRPTVKRNSILNQQRARKGKPPLQYDWHTVTIQPPQVKSEPKGGTHASPRLHDRRGHFRKLKSGARVWVSPCKVGDASKGTVFKDYKVAS